MRLTIAIITIGLFLGCSSNTPSVIDVVPDSVRVFSSEMADEYWSQRADSINARQALRAYSQLSDQNPGSISLWSKLSRSFYYSGQYLTSDPVKRDSLFMRGYEASQSILNENSQYYNLLFSTGDENMAIMGLDEDYIDVLYWGMANYGQWLSTKGPIVRLGHRDLIWTTLEHVHDLDSSYYFGAYYRYKGALLARDPENQGDTLAIREAFDLAIEIAPDYLGNYTLMAMYYCPLIQDKDLFYTLLTRVVTSNLDKSLPYYSENIYEKKIAEGLMIKAEKENWFI